MHTRTLGQGLEVSAIGLGCMGMSQSYGPNPGTRDDMIGVLRAAVDLGVTFFDTSNSYNQGRSEEVLGHVLGATSVPVVIATKGGVDVMTNDYANRRFDADRILEAAEESLKRLRRDTIDLYMLHSPSVFQLESQTWADAIEKLKARGKVRYFGISTDDHASGIKAIEMGADFLQIEYDLLDPSAEDALLPLAVKHDIGIMIRTPLARGLLSGKFRAGEGIPPEQQWRRPTGDRLQLRLGRVEQLRFLERDGQTMAQAALRWLLAQPGVHCVIPGARTVEQLEANIGAIDGDLTAEELSRVSALHAEWRAEGRW